MKTKQEHIEFWKNQASTDMGCAEALYQAGYYTQALFWAHLVLEKSAKALWIKTHEKNTPPLVHNILRLIDLTKESFTVEQMKFFTDMNAFQIQGRYPDYAESLEKAITQEACRQYLETTKKMILCLHKKLQ